MKHIGEMPAATREELTRLHRQEIAAWETGQHETAVTCRLRWCDLYREANGCSSPAPQLLLMAGGSQQAKRVQTKALWRETKEARPLVAVRTIRLVTWNDNAGATHYYHIETLACGHTNENIVIDPETPAAKRRRCHKCGDAVMEARAAANQASTESLAPEIVECPNYERFQLA